MDFTKSMGIILMISKKELENILYLISILIYHIPPYQNLIFRRIIV